MSRTTPVAVDENWGSKESVPRMPPMNKGTLPDSESSVRRPLILTALS